MAHHPIENKCAIAYLPEYYIVPFECHRELPNDYFVREQASVDSWRYQGFAIVSTLDAQSLKIAERPVFGKDFQYLYP